MSIPLECGLYASSFFFCGCKDMSLDFSVIPKWAGDSCVCVCVRFSFKIDSIYMVATQNWDTVSDNSSQLPFLIPLFVCYLFMVFLELFTMTGYFKVVVNLILLKINYQFFWSLYFGLICCKVCLTFHSSFLASQSAT